ncbi:hypothetical protein [Nisaea sp.]|uniref:hypothetical protein n=1 Tax=Nisaea sp. TaxID=2024842 RepID=UPI0032EC54FB
MHADNQGHHASGRRDDLRLSLNQLLFELSQFGSSAVVAWRPSGKGLELVLLPKTRLLQMKDPIRRVFEGPRHLNDGEFKEVVNFVAVQPTEIRLDFPIGGSANGLSHDDVESVMSRYSIGFVPFRTVFLIDVVGFSKHTPEEQASYLSTLQFCLSLAEATLHRAGLPMEMGRSTTGDGYYVWNLQTGLNEDVSLCVLMTLFSLYYKSLQQEMSEKMPLPELRMALSGGSHYVFYEPSPKYVARHEYIVGDVTINVARLIGKARADQILVGDCVNRAEGPEPWTAHRYVVAANKVLDGFRNLKVFGNQVEESRFYLTGPRDEALFRNQKIKIVDKHGIEHICYNAKVNTHMKDGSTVFSGLQHSDLRGGAKPGAGPEATGAI